MREGGSRPSSVSPLPQEVLKQMFMRAHLIAKDRDRRLSEATGINLIPDKENEELYKKFEDERVTPIEPEQIAGMVAPLIREILQQHPELKP